MFRAEAQFALNLSSSGATIGKTTNQKPRAGAGEGNRTLIFSLEGCCSTIELHPPHPFRVIPHTRALSNKLLSAFSSRLAAYRRFAGAGYKLLANSFALERIAPLETH